MHSVIARLFLAATAVVSLSFGPAHAVVPELTFLVVGDWGHGGVRQRAVSLAMAETAQSMGVRFVISTGDNFYPKGVKNVFDPRWVSSFEKIYDQTALMVPWYVVLGNHDHGGSISAEIEYSNSRWRLPARYYKQTELLADGRRADFFFLDTQSLVRGDHKQLAWLRRELASSKALWKIVIGHHPVYSGGRHGSKKGLVTLVKPLLERFGVQAYLNGHDHVLQDIVVGNVHYLTSGAGSRARWVKAVEGTRFAIGDRLGFIAVRLSSTAMGIEFIDDMGMALYSTSILP